MTPIELAEMLIATEAMYPGKVSFRIADEDGSFYELSPKVGKLVKIDPTQLAFMGRNDLPYELHIYPALHAKLVEQSQFDVPLEKFNPFHALGEAQRIEYFNKKQNLRKDALYILAEYDKVDQVTIVF